MLLNQLIRRSSRILQKFYNTLLTPICSLCGFPTLQPTNLCSPCEKDLPTLNQCCQRCARILFSPTRHRDLICGQCLTQPQPFDYTFALAPYQYPFTQLITGLKFQQQLCHAKTLGTLLLMKIREDWYRDMILPDLLIPIPLHSARLHERGFNQALEIARPIAKNCRIPLDYQSTKRVKPTAAQSGLSASKRKQNVAGAFLAAGDYSGLTIAVVDDVITTGQTISEFCKVLKKNGAAHIHVWCCARS